MLEGNLYYVEYRVGDNSCSDPECCGGPGYSELDDFIWIPEELPVNEETIIKLLEMEDSIYDDVISFRGATSLEYQAFYFGRSFDKATTPWYN